jgi:hypothetical protein
MAGNYCSVLLLASAVHVAAQIRTPPQWFLEPLFTVGNTPATELQDVASVLWLPDGRLLVADAGTPRLLVFDSTGRPLGAMGRDGSGPAEYRTLRSLALLGDTIAVQDGGNARIGLFTLSGGWIGSWVLPPISGPAIRLYRVPGNELYGVGTQRSDSRRGLLTFVRFAGGGQRDTLLRDKPPELGDWVVVCNGSDKGLHFFSTPWTPQYLEHPGPAGTILSAVTSDYRIVQRNQRGDTTAVFAGTATRLPIPDVEWKEATTDLEKYRKQDPAAACNPASVRRPVQKPAIRAFFWSSDGKLWVERYTARGFAFDVFDSRGTLLGTLPSPDRVADVEPYVRGNRVAIVTESPDGAHVVRTYRILTR